MQSTDPEIWRPVVGYEGLYEVSDQGRVRSLDREVPHPRYGRQRIAGRLLSTRRRTNPPYFAVSLLRLGKQTTCRVHVLVLEAFAGPRPAGMVARHLNGDSYDNRAANLRWDSQSENCRDRARHGTHYQALKTHCPRGHALAGLNLDPAHKKLGYRSCLSCAREKWDARYRGRAFDPTRADAIFERLTRESA